MERLTTERRAADAVSPRIIRTIPSLSQGPSWYSPDTDPEEAVEQV
ncbi:MAG: hypothetical protein ACYDHM_06530 [Acidiferrobacterales bacterium]